MSSTPSSTNPLLGIALVVNRSRDGPAFVFHYPPHIRRASATKGESGADPSESSDLGDVLLERLSEPAEKDFAGGSASSAGVAHLERYSSFDEHVVTESGSQIVPWEHVAGFPARDLAGILTPARSYHKRLFQLSLDPLYCISCPIHVPESGRWRKAKKASKSKPPKSTDESQLGLQDSDPGLSKPAETKEPEHVVEAEEAAPAAGGAGVDEEKRSSMTMYNLVFILDSRHNGLQEWISMLYSNVIKRINKAYKYSQQHSEFVWKESKRILAAKDKAREERQKMSELWADILQSSSLATSVRDIYVATSQNRIATIHLETAGSVLSPSIQMPVPSYLSDLPAEGDREQSGLWLTTAHSFLSQNAIEEPGFLDRNFGLLLMDDTKRILAELQNDRDPATSSLMEFVRLAKPTMSFYQVGQSNVLTLGQIRKYAQHFIFWRRALAIPPLHARDVYILSPNCDLTRLPQATQEWQRAFPFAPPLPSFLTDLSTSPRPYKSYCPAKAYRPAYLQMLAWLLRGGWVTQLCTFAYVVVWPEILYEVEYEMEAEELRAAESPKDAKTKSGAPSPTTTAAAELPTTTSETKDKVTSPTTITPAKDRTIEESTGEGTKTTTPAAPHDDDDIAPDAIVPPPTSQDTAERARLERIAFKAHREAADKATAHARKTPPQATAHPATNDAPHLAGLAPHIILDATKATGKEASYLWAIARRLPDGGDGSGNDGVRGSWQTMCKYFDGRCALERVALQEDMKRKEAWTLLTAMSEHLLCVRHW